MRPKTIQFDASRGPDGKVRVGVWDRICVPGHDEKDGQSTDFDLSTLSQMVDNFLERADPIPVDHNHQSNYAAQNGQPAPALAWYGALAVVVDGKIAKLGALPGVTVDGAKDGFDGRDGLWGYRHEVTELGEQLLPNFKLLSPTFLTNGTRRNGSECGYCLLAVAATNTPWQPATKITFDQGAVTMSLPTFNEKTHAWEGGDRRTLYAFTDKRTGQVSVYPTDRRVPVGPEATVRVATAAEARANDYPVKEGGWTVMERDAVAMAQVGEKVRCPDCGARVKLVSGGKIESHIAAKHGYSECPGAGTDGSSLPSVPGYNFAEMANKFLKVSDGRKPICSKCGKDVADSFADGSGKLHYGDHKGRDGQLCPMSEQVVPWNEAKQWIAYKDQGEATPYERGLAIAEFRKARVSMAAVGERYYWSGDTANDPGAYVVTINRGDGWLAIKNEKTGDVRIVPDALMTTSRWRKMDRGDDVTTMANSKTDKPDHVVLCPQCKKWVGEYGGKFEEHDRDGEPTSSRDGGCYASGETVPAGAEKMSRDTSTNAGAAGFTQRGNQMKLKKLAAYMGQKFGIKFEAGADEDDKKVGAMAKACMDGEAAEAMSAEGYDYGSGANTLEEMAKLYEDAHLEPDGDEEPPQAAMRRMAAKFRKMGQPAASMAFPPKDEDADSTELGAFAQQLGIDPRGKSRAQLMSALRAVAVPASKVAEAAKVAAQEAIAEDRARLALAEKKAAAAVLMEQLPASYPGNREALKRLAENDPEEAALLAAPFIRTVPSSAPANIFGRVTQNGAPLGKGKDARHDTGLAPKSRTVKSQAFGTIQIDDDAFAAEIERVADSKDPVMMGRIDSMLAPHDRAQKAARLMKAERIVREESPHLVPDGE